MSKVIEVGIVRPSRWTYMAAVMADKLSEGAKSFGLKKEDIPKNILADAELFASYVLKGYSFSPDLAAQSVYSTAMTVLENIIYPPQQEDIERMLFGLSLVVVISGDKVTKLENPMFFPTVDFMVRFFRKLSEMGEERE